ncbi:MAG: SPOR domain-containing protein [Saprospiraceae bacterium]|nr:SPOR domain-containing protein [Saprospiraceae bacterium]
MSDKPAYETFVLPTNSNVSDFGLTFYKDAPVFSSFRSDILMDEVEREINIQQTAHKSFLYNQKKNRLGFIKAMDGTINHIGPLSFSSNGISCAIIESKITDSYNFITSSKGAGLHIAMVNDQGEITSSKPFLYNEVGSSINAAHMAFDGTALYFSSNRKGGFGGYDIYVSYLNNGIWSLPVNLGNNVNTTGNEITPFLKGSSLYFASDYHIGLGGYDIVKSEVINGVWTTPINMGLGVNSINDDYFPAINSKGELFLTSNRLGGKGSNDIYKTMKLTPNEVATTDYTNIPKAVSLEDLTTQTQKHTGNPEMATAVSLKNADVKIVSEKQETMDNKVAFTLPEFDTKKVGSNANSEMALEGAHRIGLEEVIPTTEVFFIQLASVSETKPNFSRFKSLIRFGNVYKMNNNKSIKVRLGYYMDRKEAEAILTKVRANGFKDAFITFEVLNTAQMELILSSSDENNFTDEGNLNSKNPTEEMKSFKLGSKYKVRLASYEDPIWFDINKVKDLGRIEQWTKGGWTIFILAGYTNLEEAKKAAIQSINRGFKTAEVVIDNGGILERMKQN